MNAESAAAATKPDPSDDPSKEPLEQLQRLLGYSDDGLSEDEARRRLAESGPNEITEKKTNPFLKFLSYFWGPIPWMIEIAVILSAVTESWADLCIISALLVANGLIGFWEEYQADNAIDALKAKLALQARVKRAGRWTTLAAREVVPGDLLRVRIGDVVPADVRLLGAKTLDIDESALTGESLPVTKNGGDPVYSGSIVKRGEADAVVYATGGNTFFGKTARLVDATENVSHYQQAIVKIGDYLIAITIVLVVVIVTVALFRGDDFLQTVQFALILTVAAIPVALPTVLSVTMAVGARLLATKQAIVSRLAAIEELAGMDVLCSDKTGTLTKNELTLGEPGHAHAHSAHEVILCAALASRAENEDPIDRAVIAGLHDPDEPSRYRVTDFAPFDPIGKRTEATVVGPDGVEFRVTKGAPQVIVALSTHDTQLPDGVQKVVDSFAARGYRSLGVARTGADGRWHFLGVLPLFDPPRDDSKATIEAARGMGADLKMITGDQLAIAKETARKLGMGGNILDAGVFESTDYAKSSHVDDAIESVDGFAQVFPEHKYHIVSVLQQRGHIVGMTGDGVNDAPALKKADAGIAVSGATDAARAAADIVLLSPGLSVIIDAIEESRRIFQRMTNYTIYRISETIAILLFFTLSILAFNFYPLTAIMVVLLAVLNDGAILSIAFDRAHCATHPQKWNMRHTLGVATAIGFVGVIASFGLFYLARERYGLTEARIQTLLYLNLSVGGHLAVFVSRTRGPFWSIRPAGALFGAVVGTQAVATLIAVYGLGLMTPIEWSWAGFVWAYSLGFFLVQDVVKLAAYRIFDPKRGSGMLGPSAVRSVR